MHTFYSDGSNSPRQNVIDSAMMGLETIAITDHDITSGYLHAKEEAKKWGIEVLTGVEISTINYHILGYNFDIENKGLQDLLEFSRECQIDTTKKRIEKIKATGVPISFEKVRKIYPVSSLGKWNIVVAMAQDKECKNYLENMSILEIFNEYLKKGKVASEVSYGLAVTSKEAIDAIHEAGGVAVLAHSAKDVKDFWEIRKLVVEGLDGLEIQPHYGKAYDGFKYLAYKLRLIQTYGSDYHGVLPANRPILSRGENLGEEFW